MRTHGVVVARARAAHRARRGAPARTARPRPIRGRRPRRRSAAPARRAARAACAGRRVRRGARSRAGRRIRPVRRATAGTAAPWACRPPHGRSGPTRCRKAAIERGEPSWQTRSTSPMSMPSSSEAVATSTLQLAALEPLLGVEPQLPSRGCRGARPPPPCPSRSPRWRAARSAMRRVLTNTSVVRCCAHQLGDARRRPAPTARSTSPRRAARAAARARGRAAWRSRCRRSRSRRRHR